MVLIAVSPALLLIASNVRSERWLAQERIEERALRIVRTAAATESNSVQETRDLLAYVARLASPLDATSACAKLLAPIHEQYREYGTFGVASAAGEIACMSPNAVDDLGVRDAPASVASEAWHRAAVGEKRFAVSDYEIGEITGRPGQVLAQPVVGGGGEVRYVIFAVRSLEWIETLIEREKLPVNSSLTLWTLEGTILMRFPNPDKWRGRKIEKAPLLSRIRTGQTEGLAELAGVDGVRRLYAYIAIPKDMLAEPAYLTVGIPSAEAFAKVKEQLVRSVLIALGTILLALIIAIFGVERLIVKGIRELVTAIKEIARGELGARASSSTTGAAELRALGAAFDEMAIALEGRQEEIERIHGELLEERARLRDLSAGLVEVQEAERRRIARELHDEIGQILTGLGLLLGTARRTVTTGPAAKPLDHAEGLVKDLLRRVRELSLELRPAMLDDLGLISALIWFFERYGERTQIRVAFRHDGFTTRLPPEVEVAAYRIVQEALTNVARHAAVSEVEVVARVDGGRLVVIVRDRGKGFDPERRDPSDHTSGLTGMNERATNLGGTLTIRSSEGEGTTISAELPVPGTGEPARQRPRGAEESSDHGRARG